jgi:hypothetical protein
MLRVVGWVEIIAQAGQGFDGKAWTVAMKMGSAMMPVRPGTSTGLAV